MIPIFPTQVLDNSLHTAILVGLLVTWGLYETVGWVFAGFVVAGYLAALGIVAPASLLVVVVEAIVTYGIVWSLGVGLSRLGLGTRVFGRERFLLFVLVALPVRLFTTGLAMPRIERHLLAWGVPQDELGLGLFGVGVVLVPLAANTFWKPGLTRGLLQLAVGAGVTWAVLTGLIRFTNFDFGDFAQAFDTLAVSAWSSSRVVLVLVCTVFVAARNNLRYGWDFGGILVPALLAILVFSPVKLLTTVIEIVVLFAVYEGIIRLPWVRDLDLEGPRRIVSIYVTSYAWKWGVALVVAAVGLGVPASDLFGFGYLLTSLVVGRAHKKGRLLHTLAPLLWTTLQGVALAVPVAWALSRLPAPVLAPAVPAVPEPVLQAVPWLASQASPEPLPADVGGRGERVQRTAARLLGGRGDCALDRGDAVWILDCRDEGVVVAVPFPLGDPDAAWRAGFHAQFAPVRGVVVGRWDPSAHPTLGSRRDESATAVIRAAQRLAGDAPVVVVTSTPTGAVLHPVAPARFPEIVASLEMDALDVATGAPPTQLLGVWPALRAQDAVLALGDVPSAGGAPGAPIELEQALSSSPPGSTPTGLTADVVVPAVWRAAQRAEVGASPPRDVVRMVEASNMLLHPIDLPDGTLGWWLVRGGLQGGYADRWLFRPGGGDWVVLVGEAWRHEGLVDVGLHQHQSLRAGVTWFGGDLARVRSRRDAPDRRAPVDRLTRRLLLDAPDGVHTLLVEVAGAGPPVVRLSHGNEVPFLDVLSAVAPATRQALGPWPGVRAIAPDEEAATWSPSLAYAATWHQAVAPERLLVLWLDDSIARETRGAPEHAQRAAWYRASGVPVRSAADPARQLGPLRLGDPVRVPDVEARLQAHADHPTAATLAALQALEGWDIGVWDAGLRLVLVASGPDRVCTRVAGADDAVAYPWTGCWRRL